APAGCNKTAFQEGSPGSRAEIESEPLLRRGVESTSHEKRLVRFIARSPAPEAGTTYGRAHRPGRPRPTDARRLGDRTTRGRDRKCHFRPFGGEGGGAIGRPGALGHDAAKAKSGRGLERRAGITFEQGGKDNRGSLHHRGQQQSPGKQRIS